MFIVNYCTMYKLTQKLLKCLYKNQLILIQSKVVKKRVESLTL